ncbi:hypothetical protein Tco_0935489 [Tanacetum coccineum]
MARLAYIPGFLILPTIGSPLSQFLVVVLDHFHIHLSQLSVFGAAKVSHFKILCRVYGFQPSVNCFRAFYTSSYTKGWMSFSKRSDAAPVCHSKPLDSVKNWNNHFFWVDSTAFPLSVSLKSKILSKDPPPKLSQYDTEACDFLHTHTALFWKFPEPFLCWVGISRYYTLDENCYPTFWDGEEEMDLFAFIRHSDPTKVRVGERNLAEREVKLLKMTEGRTVSLGPSVTAAYGDSSDSIDRLFDEENDAGLEHSVEKDDDVLEEAIAKDALEVIAEKPQKKRKRKVAGDTSGSDYPPKKLRDDYQSLPPNTSGKSHAALRGIIPEGFDLTSGATEPLIVASVAPMPDVGLVDFVFGLNLRTRPPHVRYVVSSDGSHHSGSYYEATSFVRSLVADALVVTIAVTTTVDADVAAGSKARDVSKDFENIGDSTSVGGSLDTETMHRAYIPRWKVTNDFVLDDPYVCRDLTDHLAPPTLFAQLRAMDYDQLYSEFNVGAARQVCLGAKVRMRAEHTLEKKGELEEKCAEHTTLLSEKDAEIAHLNQLSVVETADAVKSTELRDLKEKNFALEVTKLTADLSGFQLSRDELNSKMASLESERDCLAAQKSSLESAFELFREHIEALQDEQAKALGDKVAELDAQLSEMAIHLDEEFYPRFLTTISGRRWFLSHGLKLVILKCLQSPEYLQALGQAIGCAVNKGIGLKAGIDHGKVERDLSMVEAYDPFVEEKYVDVVNALGVVDFSLLSELESKKESSIVDLMDSLCLEGIVNLWVQRFREEAKEKRLSLTDVMTPFVEPLSSKSLTSEANTFAAPITTLSTTFASSVVIPPSSVVSDQVLDTEPHNEDPPAVTFKKEELGTSPK